MAKAIAQTIQLTPSNSNSPNVPAVLMLFTVFLLNMAMGMSVTPQQVDILLKLTAGNIVEGEVSGNITLPVITHTQTKRQDLNDKGMYSLYSIDNANTLSAIVDTLITNGGQDPAVDLYLEAVFVYNGYPGAVNDVETQTLYRYLADDKSMSDDEIVQVATKSGHPVIRNLILGSMKEAHGHRNSIFKRYDVNCHDNNIPNDYNCGKLMDWFGGRTQVHGRTCFGNCCAAWSIWQSFDGDDVNPKILECRNTCTSSGRSCRIPNCDMARIPLNFCLSTKAKCA